MSVVSFTPEIHHPAALATQLDMLPRNFVVAGSIGRSALMGQLKPLERANGQVTDIDVIDITGLHREVRLSVAEPFPLDAALTNIVRPVTSDEWGIFIHGRDDPFALIDGDLCQPQIVRVPWLPDYSIQVLPAGLQYEIINLKGPYRKNKIHIEQFRDFVNDKKLPTDVQNIFAEYRAANWEFEERTHLGTPLSRVGKAYKRTSRIYHDMCPALIQRTVETRFGDRIRLLRRKIIR